MKKNNKKSNKKKYNIPSSEKKSKLNNKLKVKYKKLLKYKLVKSNPNKKHYKGRNKKQHIGGKRKKKKNNDNDDNNNDNNNYNDNDNDNNDNNNLSDILGKDGKINDIDLFDIGKDKDKGKGPVQKKDLGNSKSSKDLPNNLDSQLEDLSNNIDFNNLTEEQIKLLTESNNSNNNNNDLPPTYYNTLSFENKVNVDNRQGLFLPGFDFTNFLDYTNYQLRNDKDTELEDLKTIDIFGEDVDVNHDDVFSNKMGYRDYKIDNTLKPEVALSELASFNDIITEAKKYTSHKKKYVTLYGLYNMVVILSKYKKSEAQWLRVASLLEIMHKYKGGSVSKNDFFNSQMRLDTDVLNAMEEFWKTDHIFMTDKEIDEFKQSLEYYRHVKDT